jgi:hypothetical protein
MPITCLQDLAWQLKKLTMREEFCFEFDWSHTVKEKVSSHSNKGWERVEHSYTQYKHKCCLMIVKVLHPIGAHTLVDLNCLPLHAMLFSCKTMSTDPYIDISNPKLWKAVSVQAVEIDCWQQRKIHPILYTTIQESQNSNPWIVKLENLCPCICSLSQKSLKEPHRQHTCLKDE